MKRLFIVLAIMLISVTYPQQVQEDFYSGGWKIGENTTYTRITATSNLEVKKYLIWNTILVDNNTLEFDVIADGVILPAKMFEGGYAIVEAKEIFIRQATPGQFILGAWKIIQNGSTGFFRTQWAGYPSINKDILVTDLKTEQEFVLSINRSTVDCQNTSFSVYIDGNAVKDSNNNTLIFYAGSSIIGKGKKVVIRVNGTCGNSTPVTGDIKLKS